MLRHTTTALMIAQLSGASNTTSSDENPSNRTATRSSNSHGSSTPLYYSLLVPAFFLLLLIIGLIRVLYKHAQENQLQREQQRALDLEAAAVREVERHERATTLNPEAKMYIKSIMRRDLKRGKTSSELVQDLELPPETEQKLFGEYMDCIMPQVMNIPVKIDGFTYDFNNLKKLMVNAEGRRQVPHTRYEFAMNEVMPDEQMDQNIQKALQEFALATSSDESQKEVGAAPSLSSEENASIAEATPPGDYSSYQSDAVSFRL